MKQEETILDSLLIFVDEQLLVHAAHKLYKHQQRLRLCLAFKEQMQIIISKDQFYTKLDCSNCSQPSQS